MFRRAMLALMTVVIGSSAAVADDPPDPTWEYRGLAGTEVHAVRHLLGDLFVGAGDGLHILADGLWRDLARDGVAGWPVTAVGRSPYHSAHVITGRVDGQGQGALAVTYLDDGATELRLDQQPGPFSRIAHTDYFNDYRVWACAPGEISDGVVLQSGTGGELWQPVTGHGFTSPVAFASTITVVKRDIVPYIFLCGESGVRTTVDGGTTWSDGGGGLPDAAVRDVLVASVCVTGLPDKDELSCDWFFAATDSGLFFKARDDTLWSRRLPDPCTKVRFEAHMYDSRLLLLTSDRRLLLCSPFPDQVWEWEDLSAYLPAAAITDFSLDGAHIALGTLADGVFEMTLPLASSDVPVRRADLSLTAVPNPFNPATTLRFASPHAGRARLTVYDLGGRRVATLLDREIAAGPFDVVWRPHGLASGIYLARLQVDGAVAECRLALVR